MVVELLKKAKEYDERFRKLTFTTMNAHRKDMTAKRQQRFEQKHLLRKCHHNTQFLKTSEFRMTALEISVKKIKLESFF